jgi:hypothetical protein
MHPKEYIILWEISLFDLKKTLFKESFLIIPYETFLENPYIFEAN